MPALTDGPKDSAKAALTREDIPELVRLIATELTKTGSTLPSCEDPMEGSPKASGKSQLLLLQTAPTPPPLDNFLMLLHSATVLSALLHAAWIVRLPSLRSVACLHDYGSVSVCDRIWENPPYGTRAKFSLQAFIAPMVTNHPTLGKNEHNDLCSTWPRSYRPQFPFVRRVEAQTLRSVDQTVGYNI